MKMNHRHRHLLIHLLLGVSLALASLSGCHSQRSEISKPQVISPVVDSHSAGTASVQFTDITDQAGIHFVHNNGAFGKKWMPETTGGACAFLDFDKDGKEDLLLVNSGPFDS